MPRWLASFSKLLVSSAAITCACCKVRRSLAEASPMFPMGVPARISTTSLCQMPRRGLD
jgi:hypothetical protein